MAYQNAKKKAASVLRVTKIGESLETYRDGKLLSASYSLVPIHKRHV